MTRSQRRWHSCLWLALGPLILLGMLVALAARPPAPIQADTRASAGRGSSIGPALKSPTEERSP